MDLISGLPYDITHECLIRVTHEQFAGVAAVCKRWNAKIELPEFLVFRKITGHSQGVIVMVQAQFDPTHKFCMFKRPVVLVYRITLWEPDAGRWSELPPIPGLAGGLPMFCQVAGVGADLVVIGGSDQLTWQAYDSVYIYNFLSAK